MPKKKTEVTEKELTLRGEELEIMNEVLADYKGFIEYTYKNNLMIIAQGEQMLKTSNDKAKTIELCKWLDKYKEQAKMLDIARLRADGIHLKVKDVLGIKDEDGTTNSTGTWGEEDGDTANEPTPEVSESSEVLHEDK